jgi:hypothetical protein
VLRYSPVSGWTAAFEETHASVSNHRQRDRQSRWPAWRGCHSYNFGRGHGDRLVRPLLNEAQDFQVGAWAPKGKSLSHERLPGLGLQRC